ncbi:hypothetical protein BGZ60DRAFT_417161 [Tricladium varicosporioides]|nr:hypothetical protein BGZ60DRAFT_417161 [Hymenoscyphus varicosporioides]
MLLSIVKHTTATQLFINFTVTSSFLMDLPYLHYQGIGYGSSSSSSSPSISSPRVHAQNSIQLLFQLDTWLLIHRHLRRSSLNLEYSMVLMLRFPSRPHSTSQLRSFRNFPIVSPVSLFRSRVRFRFANLSIHMFSAFSLPLDSRLGILSLCSPKVNTFLSHTSKCYFGGPSF